MTDWYRKSTEEVLSDLDTDAQRGLSTEEARRRIDRYGPNELVERGVTSPWRILWEQLTALMVLILIVAAVVSFAVGDLKDTVAILIIVVLNAALGFSQEYRAEKAMAALKQLAVPTVRVRRHGQIQEISSRYLVPGDVVLLEAGVLVPADGRLVESVNLRAQEAALTGESEPVSKQTAPLEGEDLALADRKNIAFMGTVVTYGRGEAVVTATGMDTELGRIADLLQTVERETTPLQRRLNQLGKGLAAAALFLVAIVFLEGLMEGEDLELAVLTAISLAVAAVPEGLPAVVTIALALGAQRALQRNALIRKLPAVETLGSVTVICSDKTGTLTENRMTVTVLDVLGETQTIDTLLRRGVPIYDADSERKMPPQVRTLDLLVRAAALANDATLQRLDDEGDTYRAIGDPTEGALVIAAAQLDLMKPELEERWPRVAEVPFTSERKRMTTVHKVSGTPADDAVWGNSDYVAFCKGAVDGLLEISDQVWSGDEALMMTPELRERIIAANAGLAQQGQRVLGVAFRPLQHRPEDSSEAGLEQGMTFIGLVGMIDPPRPEVKTAVQVCQDAGIRPVMITGDHPLTAQQIAHELQISANGQVLTGQDLMRMSVEELEEVVEQVPVFARVSPEHKLKIVEALQDKGHIVAMTGDGVNDAPALRKADIGVAMGITGTDVSKEAADMVLLDDNFATIVSAVKEGRVIYDNIRKFIKYTMTSNLGEIAVMLFSPALGMPLALLPLQILWINLVTDGLPGLALTVEPAERDTMRRPPYNPRESIFARGLGRDIIWVGLVMGAVSLGIGYWAWSSGRETWQTILFTTITLSQMGNALALRSRRYSLFQIGLFSNKAALGAVLLTLVLQIAVIYVPALQGFLDTQPLPAGELVLSLVVSTFVFWVIEAEKWWLRRRPDRV